MNMNLEYVAIEQIAECNYPQAPFHPSERFEEFAEFIYSFPIVDADNMVYSAVRNLFIELELDKAHLGTNLWNPFKDFINPLDHIVIKPNLVFDSHPLGNAGVEAMLTNGSIIRPVIDYILLATNGKCKITICDVPLQSANWQKIIEQTGLKKLVEFYQSVNIDIHLLDLRYEIAWLNEEHIIFRKEKKVRDPLGYKIVDLKDKSYLVDISKDYKKFEITDYGLGTVSKHHNKIKNEYFVCGTILDADVFINVPKLKTHRKGGITGCLKNIIGINGDKSWIAHHRRGIDEYEHFEYIPFIQWYVSYYSKIYAPSFITKAIYAAYRLLFLKGKTLKETGMKKGGTTMEGNWHGNDTLWRTILDLNNILLYADKDGTMQVSPQRKYFAIVDGIIGMEKEGPMDGYPKKAFSLLAGFHPVAVDMTAAYLMGFDFEKIPQIFHGFSEKFFNFTPFKNSQVIVKSKVDITKQNLRFEPSKGWKNKMDRM